MYLSTDMWYKKVQVILGLIKREFNSCHRCQARVNREIWASLPSFYTPLPRLKVLYHRQCQYTQANEYHFDGANSIETTNH